MEENKIRLRIPPPEESFHDWINFIHSKDKEIEINEIEELDEKRNKAEENFIKLYDAYKNRNITQLLADEINNNPSFLEQVVKQLEENIKTKNSIAHYLSAKHTTYTETGFTSTEIASDGGILSIATTLSYQHEEEITNNKEAYMRAKEKLEQLNNLEAIRLNPKIKKNSIIIKEIEDLEIIISDGEKDLKPTKRKYKSKVPKNKRAYPTIILNEGDPLEITINNKGNKEYLIFPVINGTPLNIDEIVLDHEAFHKSPLPIKEIKTTGIKIKPGERKEINKIFINKINLFDNSYPNFNVNYLKLLPYMITNIEKNMDEKQRKELTKHKKALEYLILINATKELSSLESKLRRAKKSQLYIGRGVKEYQKKNEELGTLGFLIFEVSNPPVKPKKETRFNYRRSNYNDTKIREITAHDLRGSKSIGAAEVSFGHDENTDSRYDIHITEKLHYLKGFVPINILSRNKKK